MSSETPSHAPQSDASPSCETILVETEGGVGIITLNRPSALNALSRGLIADLNAALDDFEADDAIGAIVLTGSEKAFAAGADIREMQSLGYVDIFLDDFLARWERLAATRKPVVAAVSGFALGGGCELALMCDLVIAADNARFGQPEISLGLIPGAGGTQRLARAVGKAKTMDMVLTGRMIDAVEAERIGLVSRVVPAAEMRAVAVAAAAKIASLSRPSVLMAKEAVNRAYETPLAEGIRTERRLFHSLFATEDAREGMAAFLDKRPPRFRNR
jgi:enoyl-CoA hydratase